MKKLAAAVAILALASMPWPSRATTTRRAQAPAEFGKGPVKDVVLTGYLTDFELRREECNDIRQVVRAALHQGRRPRSAEWRTRPSTRLQKLGQTRSDHLGQRSEGDGQARHSTNVIRVTSSRASPSPEAKHPTTHMRVAAATRPTFFVRVGYPRSGRMGAPPGRIRPRLGRATSIDPMNAREREAARAPAGSMRSSFRSGPGSCTPRKR